MWRYRLSQALALGMTVLFVGSVRAQITYEFANATTGVAHTNYNVTVGGLLPVQIYLHETTAASPLFHSDGGLGSGGVRLPARCLLCLARVFAY